MGAAYLSSDATVSAHKAAAITTSDSTVIPATRAVYVGGTGDLVVEMVDGGVVTFTGVAGGAPFPVQVVRILAATTATGLVAMY